MHTFQRQHLLTVSVPTSWTHATCSCRRLYFASSTRHDGRHQHAKMAAHTWTGLQGHLRLAHWRRLPRNHRLQLLPRVQGRPCTDTLWSSDHLHDEQGVGGVESGKKKKNGEREIKEIVTRYVECYLSATSVHKDGVAEVAQRWGTNKI